MTNFESISNNPELFPGKVFADGLRSYQWSSSLEPLYPRLRATEKTIIEVPDGKHLFSEALWNLCFPISVDNELWHYTTLDKLTSILQGPEIWLHSIANRMDEGELTEFAYEFNYLGFLSVDESGARVVDTLARDLFYLSLSNKDEPDELSNHGEVRLRLRVAPVNSRSELRRMQYSVGSDHPLITLRDFAKTRLNRDFVPYKISRMGAFMLNPYFDWESEVRLLLKRFNETSDLTIRKSGTEDVVVIPIGKPNDRVRIDLLWIEVDTPANLEKVKIIVAKSSLSSLKISVFGD